MKFINNYYLFFLNSSSDIYPWIESRYDEYDIKGSYSSVWLDVVDRVGITNFHTLGDLASFCYILPQA